MMVIERGMEVTASMEPLGQAQMKTAAAHMAKAAEVPFIFALRGEPGMGKTTFASAFIRELAPQAQIGSPTFNLMQSYETSKGILWHCDLYRLEKLEDIFEIGLLEQISGGLALIEWPDLILPYLPADRTAVIDFLPHGQDKRQLNISLLKA